MMEPALLPDMGVDWQAGLDRFGACWRGRTALVVGLGRSGLAAAEFLQRRGCEVRATDDADSSALRETADHLEAAGVARIELGGHSRSLLEGCEAVIASPGVPERSGPLAWAQELGLPVLSEIELASRFCAAPIIAVTGTNGKSSVVTMIQQLVEAAGRHAVACGNLGIPFITRVEPLTPEMTAVVEVSSFQLLGCTTFRPAIGVLLNLGTNHLDRHPSREHYIAAKATLFAAQTPDDHAVLNAADPDVVALGGGVHAQRIWFGVPQDNAPGFELDPATCRSLPVNLQAVVQVGRILRIPDPLTWQVLRAFKGLEHRLEPVATIRGVHLVNDAKSTTPESLLYALERCRGAVVPIIGGRDKGLHFELLRDALHQPRIRGVVLIGESRPKLRTVLNGSCRVCEAETLDTAIDAALGLAQSGDTVLFSPGCASFDMFKNFEERGRAFKQLVLAKRQAAS